MWNGALPERASACVCVMPRASEAISFFGGVVRLAVAVPVANAISRVPEEVT